MGIQAHQLVTCSHRAPTRYWEVGLRVLSAQFGQGNSDPTPQNLKGAEQKRTLQKYPFWTTVSPHDPFAAPLARPDNRKWQRLLKSEERNSRDISAPNIAFRLHCRRPLEKFMATTSLVLLLLSICKQQVVQCTIGREIVTN